MLTNSSEMPVEVKIYVVKCKIETSTSPIDAWSSGLTKNRITGDNVNNIGSSPMLSYDFN